MITLLIFNQKKTKTKKLKIVFYKTLFYSIIPQTLQL